MLNMIKKGLENKARGWEAHKKKMREKNQVFAPHEHFEKGHSSLPKKS